MKALDGCLRLLRDEQTGTLLFKQGDIADLTEEQRERAAATVRIVEKRIADLRGMLE